MRVTGPEPTEVGPDGQLLWKVNDVHYDLEPFVNKHPGGEVAIRMAQGIECTNLFESYHPQKGNARRVLEAHRFRPKGEETIQSPASEPPKAPQLSQFKQDLDKMVAAHFAGKGRNAHKATYSHMLLCAGFFLAELVCWAGWFRGSWTYAALLPIFFWLTAVNVSHDASHMCFSSKGWINEICTFAAAPLLYEPSTWYYQHVISHHVHTNHADIDADLQHFAPLKLHQEDKRPHPLGEPKWTQYLKVVGVGFHLCLFVPLVRRTHVHARPNHGRPHLRPAAARCSAVLTFFCSVPRLSSSLRAARTCRCAAQNQIDELRLKIYHEHFAPAVWIPAGLKPFLRHRMKSTATGLTNIGLIIYSFATFGFLKGLAFILVPYGICSLLFLLFTQVSHIQPDVQAAELQDEPDFFKRQATTSVDYWTTSRLARVASGGLNTQALHHSLPYVSSCHYTDLYPAFEAVCARHGVKLCLRRGLFHAASTGCKHVWNVNGGWEIMSRGTF